MAIIYRVEFEKDLKEIKSDFKNHSVGLCKSHNNFIIGLLRFYF